MFTVAIYIYLSLRILWLQRFFRALVSKSPLFSLYKPSQAQVSHFQYLGHDYAYDFEEDDE